MSRGCKWNGEEHWRPEFLGVRSIDIVCAPLYLIRSHCLVVNFETLLRVFSGPLQESPKDWSLARLGQKCIMQSNLLCINSKSTTKERTKDQWNSWSNSYWPVDSPCAIPPRFAPFLTESNAGYSFSWEKSAAANISRQVASSTPRKQQFCFTHVDAFQTQEVATGHTKRSLRLPDDYSRPETADIRWNVSLSDENPNVFDSSSAIWGPHTLSDMRTGSSRYYCILGKWFAGAQTPTSSTGRSPSWMRDPARSLGGTRHRGGIGKLLFFRPSFIPTHRRLFALFFFCNCVEYKEEGQENMSTDWGSRKRE